REAILGGGVQRSQSTGSTSRPLKIAYLCDISPHEAWSYSGGNTRILKAVERFADVTVLSSGWHGAQFFRRAVEAMPEAWTLRMRFRAHIALSRIIARGVRRELAASGCDVLFGAYSFHSLLNLRVPPGITTVFTSDATPTVYERSEIGAAFGSFFSLSRILDPWILRAETKVFQSTDLMLWPSDWLRDEAAQLYGLRDGQSAMVPWGAGIAPPPLESLLPHNPMTEEVRLLLVGRDWFMKGGPVAVDVLDALQGRGVNAHLTVVGCVPPDFHMREAMTVHANLDKAKPEELVLLESLYRRAHFMVMPSFESYGFAFCEASAYGLPSLCLRVGGVPVVDGENGFALPKGSDAGAFAERIVALQRDPEGYRALRERTQGYYERALNWDAWSDAAERLIRAKLAEKARRSTS
ncbi:MAG: glycosyltransferase family 4 protein, partial [Pseudomonadota bacterium]